MPTPTPSPRATLADVARAAGVSKATVSKTLNGRDDVATTTRERVLAAVAEIGYRPTTHPVPPGTARALAVVFDIPASPYIMNVLQGVLSSTTDADMDLLVRLAPDLAARTQRTAAHAWVAAQRDAGVAGIIGLTLSEPDALLDAAAEAGVPFVMVDPIDTRHRRMVSVGSSNWAGARAAATHLISLGHRRIAWIGGPESSAAARDRFHGYRAALDSAGIELERDLVRSDQFDVAAGSRHARDLLTRPDRPSAIMAADDEIAVGVLATAHELGIDVPSALSVIGFDDTPQAAWTTPPLTSVHQHLEGMGRMAVQTALTMASGVRPASRHVELATTLTLRATTGPGPHHVESAAAHR
ncbi:LacI family DNA-binding transcriptional regulator [Cellulomonas bogoriensis]|uniref:LacI family transcriptional regulator n=1 Tax=Cellulomonas bogoriensis 69B4 = DSM 16987 TaxID=1386082 RepID=A0A0A0BZ19_9CELL|nr:substrate-binding domain-containing protein [Cellulomonas bogoriensis]KGM13643.1 LacI family transcriptional regulator [Cellulomonas bogoriensis 69B4 = DSM 16987]